MSGQPSFTAPPTTDPIAAVPGDRATGAASLPPNALTVDVEDYFHVEAFAGHIARADWDDHAPRVETNTLRVLDLFGEYGAVGTFFLLGWVVERFPGLVRRIVADGHEVASHGFCHARVGTMSPEAFRDDVRRAKALIEDVAGCAVLGYRAPSFSIGTDSLWAFDVLAEEGYAYSSSIYPIHHDLYGMPGAPRFAFAAGHPPGLLEIPVSTVAVFGRKLPCGGGGYFRLLPYGLSRWAWRRVNRRDAQPVIFYFHPWEIDPDQPRQHQAPLKSRLRHYVNLARMEGKLRRALADFRWGRMDDIFLERRGAAPAPVP